MAKEVENQPEQPELKPADNNDKQKQLNDLGTKSCRSMVAVIDAMCQRGAFKGEELSTIGLLLSVITDTISATLDI